MRRTAKYESRPLNRGKRRQLIELVDAFCRVKSRALTLLGRTKAWDYLDKPKVFRDAMKSHHVAGVPVHLQDQAAFDAAHTMRRYVESSLARAHAKARIFQQFDGIKRRYAYWLLKRDTLIGALLRGEAPLPEHFSIGYLERKEVVRFLRRLLRKSLGTPPRLRLRRSMALDDTLYKTFDHHGHTYVAISSSTKRKRLIIPLRGQGAIYGSIRVIWEHRRGTAMVHMPYDVRLPKKPPAGRTLALDAGVTEVLATNTGEKLGDGYGKLLERLTEETARSGKARNRLHQLAKKAEAAGDTAKASRIRRYNLGGKKLRKRVHKARPRSRPWWAQQYARR